MELVEKCRENCISRSLQVDLWTANKYLPGTQYPIFYFVCKSLRFSHFEYFLSVIL